MPPTETRYERPKTYSYGEDVVINGKNVGKAMFNSETGQPLLPPNATAETGDHPQAYGPNLRPVTTPAAATTPTPAASTTTQDTGRYERITSDRQNELNRLYGIVDGSQAAPDKATIREELMKNNQALIDSITAQYARTLDQERQAGQSRNNRQRGVNVASGLSGSDFGSSAAQGVEDKNTKILQSIETERDAKIQSILSNVEFTAEKQFKEEQQNYRSSAEDQIKRFSEFKEQALADVSAFASSGVSSTDLKEKSPDTWAALLKQTGYSDQALSAMFAAARPQADKVFQEKVGNNIVIGYRDPQTGKVSTEKIELGEGYTDFKIIDDKPYFVDMENGKLTPAEGFVPTPKAAPASATYKSGKLVIPKSKLAEGEQALDASRGPDGYVDSSIYKSLHDDWIADGGILKDFLTQFPAKNYINPKNVDLPPFLRSPVKADSSSSRAPLFEAAK